MDSYTDITYVTIPAMRLARYVMISPNPEDDVINYMNNWAARSGLLALTDYQPRQIGWDFPFVSKEQSEKFGLRGYVSAYILPPEFKPACSGAEIAEIPAAMFAKIRITNPMRDPFKMIPPAYQLLMQQVDQSGLYAQDWENRFPFEEILHIEGCEYMDICIPIKPVAV